jgi:hypothetical protein
MQTTSLNPLLNIRSKKMWIREICLLCNKMVMKKSEAPSIWAGLGIRTTKKWFSLLALRAAPPTDTFPQPSTSAEEPPKSKTSVMPRKKSTKAMVERMMEMITWSTTASRDSS